MGGKEGEERETCLKDKPYSTLASLISVHPEEDQDMLQQRVRGRAGRGRFGTRTSEDEGGILSCHEISLRIKYRLS